MKDVREEYHADGLTEAILHDDPLEQARRWVDEAIEAGLPLPNAITLATVNANGQPSSRVVLLKGIEQQGFTFFTHYNSRKGEEIASNPKVSFTMFWQPFDRQMIVIGEAQKVDQEESDSYFASRPYASQVSAAISPQSQPASREWLEAEVVRLEQEFPSAPVPRPEQWGGYRISPTEIQFWHGRPSRLHDRFRYVKQSDGRWQRERLAP
ncbi:pyridoxamine 5'-phosphate oxidase [Alcanivorax sp.]|jgi:pyridoxamine 5'-phosphate oxidase|uniref:pyridoxamine 5'-phosphate oxidase n=1 Tax=Alcanivorax sp. TaxID=1872427 RepID=UPI0032D97BD8